MMNIWAHIPTKLNNWWRKCLKSKVSTFNRAIVLRSFKKNQRNIEMKMKKTTMRKKFKKFKGTLFYMYKILQISMSVLQATLLSKYLTLPNNLTQTSPTTCWRISSIYSRKCISISRTSTKRGLVNKCDM